MSMSEETEPQNQPTWNTGDQVTISRGNKRGQIGKVVDVDTALQEYAIRLDEGGLLVASFSSVKAPIEPTVTRGQLTEALNSHGLDTAVILDRVFGQA